MTFGLSNSDTISLVSLGLSAGALFYTWTGVRAARVATLLQVFDGIFRDIKALDDDYFREFKSKSAIPTKQWCFNFFNTIEYLAYLLNRGLVLRDELQGFYKDAVLHWYKTFVENCTVADLNDPDFYPEFKKLCRRVQNGK